MDEKLDEKFMGGEILLINSTEIIYRVFWICNFEITERDLTK